MGSRGGGRLSAGERWVLVLVFAEGVLVLERGVHGGGLSFSSFFFLEG